MTVPLTTGFLRGKEGRGGGVGEGREGPREEARPLLPHMQGALCTFIQCFLKEIKIAFLKIFVSFQSKFPCSSFSLKRLTSV